MKMPAGYSKTLTEAVTEILKLYDEKQGLGIQEVEYKGQTIRLQKMQSGLGSLSASHVRIGVK